MDFMQEVPTYISFSFFELNYSSLS